MKNKLIIFLSFIGLGLFVSSCFEQDEIGPVLEDSSTFVAAELNNSATANPVTLDPEQADAEFETYTWTKADFGVQIPVSYRLELDTGNFNAPVSLATTNDQSAELTVDDFNDAMLELGLEAFQEHEVNLRVVTISQVDTMHSQSITRLVTPYRLSDCGDYCTVGLIGSATAGGWDTDTDLRLADASGVDKNTWTKTLYLMAGEVKFRASDAWDVNWGAGDFPSGTATQNGANIPIGTAGYYKVTFNSNTGDYTFTALAGTEYGTVGIIGTATAGGWDSDTDLTQNANDPHIWEGTFTLAEGEMKFRANDAWDVNWGSDAFPSGFATGGGPNIPVAVAGTYSIWFHDVTGEYLIMKDGTVYTSVGIIGSATPNGWDSDTDMIKDPTNPYKYSLIMTFADGEAKFRADDAWDNNWGGSTFPSGVGSKGGPNIPVPAGKYVVSFNSGTGEYRFLK